MAVMAATSSAWTVLGSSMTSVHGFLAPGAPVKLAVGSVLGTGRSVIAVPIGRMLPSWRTLLCWMASWMIWAENSCGMTPEKLSGCGIAARAPFKHGKLGAPLSRHPRPAVERHQAGRGLGNALVKRPGSATGCRWHDQTATRTVWTGR